MKYLGITIGPIIRTLSMARKPRELWSASYLFSGLMEKLITEILKEATIISPGIASNNDIGVGLYPDRLFCKEYQCGFEGISKIVNTTKINYANNVNVFVDYFKTYAVEINAENDGQAVDKLNKKLDFMELHNVALSDEAEESARKLIVDKQNKLGSGNIKEEMLSEIASAQLEQISPKEYNDCLNEAKKEEDKNGKDNFM